MTHSPLRRISPAPMTDTEREAEIARLSAEMEAAYAIWQSDGCFAARDDADRLMRQRDDLVRGRGAATAGAVEGGGVMRKEVIGDATLYLGDCLEVLPTLPKVDAVITDPPYGVDLGSTKGAGGAHGLSLGSYESYADTYENYVNQIVPALKLAMASAERASIFIGPHIHELPKFDALGGVYCSAATGRHQWGFKNFLPVLFYGTYPDLHKGAQYPTVIASNETAEKNGHPVPKPLGWMQWLVNLTTRRGETAIDPFMGSGTTGVAAIQLGRSFIGIEREPKYFDIACRRIEQAYKQRPLFEVEPPKQPQQLEIGA